MLLTSCQLQRSFLLEGSRSTKAGPTDEHARDLMKPGGAWAETPSSRPPGQQGGLWGRARSAGLVCHQLVEKQTYGAPAGLGGSDGRKGSQKEGAVGFHQAQQGQAISICHTGPSDAFKTT